MFLRCDEVDEREADVKPVEVLAQTAVAHLNEGEAQLENSEDVLHVGASLAFDAVGLAHLGQIWSLERQRRQMRSSACGACPASTADRRCSERRGLGHYRFRLYTEEAFNELFVERRDHAVVEACGQPGDFVRAFVSGIGSRLSGWFSRQVYSR